MVKSAQVNYKGELVGAVAKRDDSPVAVFEYAPSWIDKGIELSPLQMPLRTGTYQFPLLSSPTYKGLPSLLADSLPDDFGNAVINSWLASEGKDPSSFTAIDRLLYTGSRGMGALEFSPAIENGHVERSEVDLASLVELAQKVLDSRNNFDAPLVDKKAGLTSLLQVGTSAGGARPKAVIAINKDRTHIVSGQVQIPKGYDHYLLKFDGVSEHKTNSELWGDPKGFGLMEYAYYLMAKDAGISMSHCELLKDSDGRSHFMTQRFDRRGNDKRHYLSLCGMTHADYKKPGHFSYEELFVTARKLRLSRAEAVELYRRMVFNVIARNHDDHTKNFGFVMSSKGHWQLAPAFDVAYSYKPGSEWVNSHQLSLNGKRDGFTKDDLLAVAKQIGNFNKEAKQIVEQVSDVVAGWEGYANKVGVFDELKKEIKGNLRLGLV